MATKREDCTRDKFSSRLDPRYGYFVKDCKDEREKKMLAFLVPIFSRRNPITSLLSSPPPCFLHTPRRRWWIGQASLESWCTNWQPTPNAATFLTLGLSSSTFTHTETYSLTKITVLQNLSQTLEAPSIFPDYGWGVLHGTLAHPSNCLGSGWNHPSTYLGSGRSTLV